MLGQTEILKYEFESIRQDLIEKHLQLGMKASGQWIDSLKVDVNRLSAVIYGQPYTEQLVNGRAPGKFPPIDEIRQWIVDKNITPFGKISISSLAFLIARKIAKDGTKYFQQGGTELVESVITPERIQIIIDKTTEFYINSFVSEITGIFKEFKAVA